MVQRESDNIAFSKYKSWIVSASDTRREEILERVDIDANVSRLYLANAGTHCDKPYRKSQNRQ
jgi:hypothetical protein